MKTKAKIQILFLLKTINKYVTRINIIIIIKAFRYMRA